MCDHRAPKMVYTTGVAAILGVVYASGAFATLSVIVRLYAAGLENGESEWNAEIVLERSMRGELKHCSAIIVR